jgi:hypothetical protein
VFGWRNARVTSATQSQHNLDHKTERPKAMMEGRKKNRDLRKVAGTPRIKKVFSGPPFRSVKSLIKRRKVKSQTLLKLQRFKPTELWN